MKKAREKSENIRPRESNGNDTGDKPSGGGNKGNHFSGFEEFTIVTLVVIASMLGILGVGWFIRAISG